MLLFGMDRKPAPKKCPDCKSTLSKPKYAYGDLGWHVECNCGTFLQWSWPNVWKQRSHIGPLFQTNATVQP